MKTIKEINRPLCRKAILWAIFWVALLFCLCLFSGCEKEVEQPVLRIVNQDVDAQLIVTSRDTKEVLFNGMFTVGQELDFYRMTDIRDSAFKVYFLIDTTTHKTKTQRRIDAYVHNSYTYEMILTYCASLNTWELQQKCERERTPWNY